MVNCETERILVTGGAGVVGTELQRQIPLTSGYDNAVIFSPAVDVADQIGVAEVFKTFKPTIIFHLAAKTNVDWCEGNKEACYNVNVAGTMNMVSEAKEAGAIFVYPSTFYVYNLTDREQDRPFDERLDKPNLDGIKGVYSRSKFLGELEVLKSGIDKYFIVRFGALFGGGLKDKKFVSKVLDMIKIGEREIKMVSDRIVQPSSVQDTVRNLLVLVKTPYYGIYNMVGHGSASYYEYAQEIIKILGKTDVRVIPISSSQFKEKAPRVKNLSAVNGRLSELGLDLMRDWRRSLEDYLSSLKKEGFI